MNADISVKIGRSGLTCLQFQGLEDFDTIKHAVFTRQGGMSREPYRSLNTCFSVGDEPGRVRGNRKLVRKSMGADELVFCRQVHGTVVQIVPVSPDYRDKVGGETPPVGDAMVTNSAGKFLAIQVADCQPVLVYDPVRKVVANIHSGWRGSICNIIGMTIQVLADTFGSSERDLLAAIGPSLGPCCAEFVNYRREIPRPYWEYKSTNNHFDFWALSRDQLLEAGLVRDHIFSSELCTRCRTDLFYSYRGEGNTGRFAAVIGLK